MFLRYYVLSISLLSLGLNALGQGVATSQKAPTFFIGVHGGLQENVVTNRNTKSYVGVSSELRTDFGFTIRSLIVGSVEEVERFRRSEFSEILAPEKLLQISLEIGPSIHIASFGRRVKWHVGGGLLLNYNKASWVSSVEVINSTNERVITSEQNTLIKLRPLAESNFLIRLSHNWDVSISGAVGIHFAKRRDTLRSFSTPTSQGVQFSDLNADAGYARTGIGVLYRLGTKGTL